MSTLMVGCECGQQMKVPKAALGKTATCVGCGGHFKITRNKPRTGG